MKKKILKIMSIYPMGHSLKNRKTQKFYPDQNRR